MLNAKYIRIEPLVGHTHRQTDGQREGWTYKQTGAPY